VTVCDGGRSHWRFSTRRGIRRAACRSIFRVRMRASLPAIRFSRTASGAPTSGEAHTSNCFGPFTRSYFPSQTKHPCFPATASVPRSAANANQIRFFRTCKRQMTWKQQRIPRLTRNHTAPEHPSTIRQRIYTCNHFSNGSKASNSGVPLLPKEFVDHHSVDVRTAPARSMR